MAVLLELKTDIEVDNGVLDGILALQMVVAWAGELAEEPRRLGWWRSDLTDALGGGGFFRRLVPSTHRFAAFQALRTVAISADELARQELPEPERVRTLFYWGYGLDRLLRRRLKELKVQNPIFSKALALPLDTDKPWLKEDFIAFLEGMPGDAGYVSKRQGRELKNPAPQDTPQAQLAQVKQLAKALLPLEERYPLAYFRVSKD